MPGTLYLVATPIGNLEDITARALRILREVDLIAAEDTRHSRKLLMHFDIRTSLVSYHEHSGDAATSDLVRQMRDEGRSIALITDAGTPAISDPGVDLVRAAVDAGVTVCPIPGPSAPIAALIASGLPPARFAFEGFLPRTRGPRLDKLKALSAERRTVIFFESPERIGATLGEIAKAFGEGRTGCVAREITKLHEEFRRGTLGVLAAHYGAEKARGECVIVVAGLPEGESAAEPEVGIGEGARPNDLIRLLASEMGIDRRALYQAVVALKRGE